MFRKKRAEREKEFTDNLLSKCSRASDPLRFFLEIMKDMRKKYSKPTLMIETMNLPLLVETSEIPVGGTGSFNAKETSLYLDEEEDE